MTGSHKKASRLHGVVKRFALRTVAARLLMASLEDHVLEGFEMLGGLSYMMASRNPHRIERREHGTQAPCVPNGSRRNRHCYGT